MEGGKGGSGPSPLPMRFIFAFYKRRGARRTGTPGERSDGHAERDAAARSECSLGGPETVVRSRPPLALAKSAPEGFPPL